VDHFFYLLITLVLTNLVAAALCMVVSSFTPSLSFGNLVAIICLLFSMLFGGFLINKEEMPAFIGWIQWTSFLMYSFEILMVNELLGATFWFNPRGYNMNPVAVDGSVFLTEFGMDPDKFFFDMIVLGSMATSFLIVSYLLLRFLIKERR